MRGFEASLGWNCGLRRSRGTLLERRSQAPQRLLGLQYNYQHLPLILGRMQATAPKGADLTSWRYR